MSGDWLLDRFSAVERAAHDAQDALDRAAEVFEPARQDRLAGRPLQEIAQRLMATALEPRRQVAANYHAYQVAVAELRSAVIRALVDGGGVSLSDLARQMGLSRQALTRLYQREPGDHEEPE